MAAAKPRGILPKRDGGYSDVEIKTAKTADEILNKNLRKPGPT